VEQPKTIEVEVVDEPPRVTPAPAAAAASPAPSGAPIHPLSAVLLIAVDNLWNLADWTVISWILTIPLSFISVFVPTFFIQKFLKKDRVGRALGLSTLMAVLAAIPTSIFGTPIGLALLAWTGLNRFFGRTVPGGVADLPKS
jgi:ABC-type sulfate transport system permease component